MPSLNRSTRQAEIGVTAERPGIVHFEPCLLAEEIHCALDILGLPLEAGEHAARHCALSAPDQEIGIAERRKPIIKGHPIAVRPVGFEDIADSDGVCSPWPDRKNG